MISREAQYSEEVRQVVELVLLEIAICITQAIEKKAKLPIPAFMISIHSFKEPLPLENYFRRGLIDCPSEFGSLVVQGGRWEKEDEDAELNSRHFKVHHLVKTGCFSRCPSPFFITVECLVCLSSEVGLLRLPSSELAALSGKVECSDV